MKNKNKCSNCKYYEFDNYYMEEKYVYCDNKDSEHYQDQWYKDGCKHFVKNEREN